MEQIFSIHLFRSEPLNFQGFLPVFDGDGTDGTDVNILSSYIRKIYKICVYKQIAILSVPSVPNP